MCSLVQVHDLQLIKIMHFFFRCAIKCTEHCTECIFDAECEWLLLEFGVWSKWKKNWFQMIWTFNIAYFIWIQSGQRTSEEDLKLNEIFVFSFQMCHMWFFNYLRRFTRSIHDCRLSFFWKFSVFNQNSELITRRYTLKKCKIVAHFGWLFCGFASMIWCLNDFSNMHRFIHF